MKLKSIVLCTVVTLFLVAGCSKSSTTTSAVSAFIGNYHMHDSINYAAGVGTNNVSNYYDMSIVADPTHSDRVIFNNIAGYGGADTAVVSGTLASFTVCPSCTTYHNTTTALITGNTIKLSGGIYSITPGYNTYASGTGVKF